MPGTHTSVAKTTKPKSTVPRTYSRVELIKAAGELAFETQHFRCYRTLKDDRKLAAFSAAASQAVGYTSLIHLRVLVGFFFGRPSQDDCNVDHFKVLSDFVFPDSWHVRTADTDKVIEVLNKRLAHLTATRWEKSAEPWDFYNAYAPTILNLIDRFEQALPQDLATNYQIRYQGWESSHRGAV